MSSCNEFYGLTGFNRVVGYRKAFYPVAPGSMEIRPHSVCPDTRAARARTVITALPNP